MFLNYYIWFSLDAVAISVSMLVVTSATKLPWHMSVYVWKQASIRHLVSIYSFSTSAQDSLSERHGLCRGTAVSVPRPEAV